MNRGIQSDSKITIFLKSPFFNLYRDRKAHYLVRVSNSLVQGQNITLSSARQQLSAVVLEVKAYNWDKVPWFVLDELGYTSRQQLRLQLMSIYTLPDISKIYVAKLAI